MSIIQLKDESAIKYKSYLQSYRKITGKEPTAIQRAEAFFCAKSNNAWDIPSWIKNN